MCNAIHLDVAGVLISYGVGVIGFAIWFLTYEYAKTEKPPSSDIGSAVIGAIIWPVSVPLGVIVGVAQGLGAHFRKRRLAKAGSGLNRE